MSLGFKRLMQVPNMVLVITYFGYSILFSKPFMNTDDKNTFWFKFTLELYISEC